MYSKENLEFANYDPSTRTNNKVDNPSQLLVYRDSEHSIYIVIGNASPYEVSLVDTFQGKDWFVIGLVEPKGVEGQLMTYLNRE